MPLTLKQIDDTIEYMDKTYDANFCQWIKNEDNCKIVGNNLKKYLGSYRDSEFITVIKWVVKDWTLKSIIIFSKKLFIEDICDIDPDQYAKRIKIISGLVYTWGPMFVSEFLLTCSVDMSKDQKTDFLVCVLNVFESKKLAEILLEIESKTDLETKMEIVDKFENKIYKNTSDRWRRTDSMLDAYRLV